MIQIEQMGETRDVVGEGPVWCQGEQALYWVDIRGPFVRRFTAATGVVDSWRMPELVGSLAVCKGGGLILALKSSLSLFDPSTQRFATCAAPEADRANVRFNDGKADRRGRFWAATMNDAERRPDGTLYCYDGHQCKATISDIVIPNSLCWSPDDCTMYFADSYLHTLFAFDYDLQSGRIGSRREFARMQAPAIPDGATVDAEGYVWCAEYGGWRVSRFSPDGRLDRMIELPVEQPTSCAFGGARFELLYVTTASQRLSSDQLAAQPLAGALLAIDVGVKGLPEPMFAG